MSTHQTALDLVIQRFANIQRTQIEYLYQEDPIFHEICQDYAECVRMRDRYADDPTVLEAPRYERDYEELIEALEEEMRAILIEMQFASSSRGRSHAISTMQSGKGEQSSHALFHPSTIISFEIH